MKLLGDILSGNKRYLQLILVVVPLLLYLPSLWYSFSPMDEQWLIVKDSNFLLKWNNFILAFKDTIQTIYYRPVFIISLMLDAHWGGMSPFAFHFSNVFFHIASVLTVFKLLLLLTSDQAKAFLAALLFAVHPLMLHAVAWIPGRNDSLLCWLSLLSLIYFIHYLKSKKNKFLLLNMVFFILAFFTKESSVVLPLLYIALYFCYERPHKKLGLLVASWFGISLLWFVLRNSLLDFYPKAEMPPLIILQRFLSGFLSFVGKALVPLQQSVSPSSQTYSIWLGILGVLLATYLLFKANFLNKKLAWFGMGMFVVMLIIPVAYGAISPLGEHYEHRAYTSMAGLMIFITHIRFKNSRIESLAWLLFILLFSLKTIYRMPVYKSPESYLNEGIRDCKENYIFHFMQGDLFYSQQRYTEAIAAYSRAIQLHPERPELYNNRANPYLALQKKKEAYADYDMALQLSGFKAEVCLNRLQTFQNYGDWDKCMDELELINQKHPGLVPANKQREIYLSWLNFNIGEINKLIAAKPNKGILYVNRAKYYMDKRLGKEALLDLKKACELEPQNKEFQSYFNELKRSLSP